MLPEEHRLSSTHDFNLLKRHGESVRCPFFVLLYRENKKDKSRFGFVTSTKFDKRATKRNRARRLLREAVRQQLSDIASGYDMMFIARAPLKEAGFEEVSSSLDKVLSKVSLL